jgi:parallel beta-helix repeat protein
MSNGDSSDPTLDGCTFTGNTAVDGGGMYNYENSNPTLTNCTFTGNTATGDLWGYQGLGGGMLNLLSSPTLTNCIFTSNTANNSGGGINANIGSAPVITYCTFVGNTAGSGGQGSGGGMIIWDTDGVTMSDCVFEGNIANNMGGGVYAANYYDQSAANLTLLSCSFTNNTAGQGGGQYEGGGGIYNWNDPNTTIIDTLVCGNTPDQIYGDWTDNGGNTIADVCPVCPDINGDGYVNVNDLLIVIGYWGTIDSPADVNEDGIVDVSDLLMVIGNWGPCE